MRSGRVLHAGGRPSRRPSALAACLAAACGLTPIAAVADLSPPGDRSYLWRSEEAFGYILPGELQRGWPRIGDYGYDVEHVHLDLAVDFGASLIAGAGTLTLTIAGAELPELPVDLDDNLTVTGVTLDGEPSDYARTADQVLLQPASALAPGTRHEVRIAYAGRPREVGNKSLRFRAHEGVPLVYALSTPYSTAGQTVIPISHYWRPCKDVPDDKSTFSAAITVPNTMLACANGLLVATVENPDGTRTFSWEHDYPIAPYLITFGATNYVTLEDVYQGPGGDAAIQHFVYPEKRTQAVESFNIVIPAMAFFAARFGEYPYLGEKFGMFLTSPGPAVEQQTMVAYPANLVDGTHQYDWIVVHELAHMWWGDCVTCRSWEHVWLNEGFASYAEALWFEHLGGPGALRGYMAGMNNGPYPGTVYDPPYVWHAIAYEKGAWVLHMLRRILGDLGFFRFVREYRAAHEYGSAATEDLEAAAEAVYGADLDWFFEPWVYREGQPAYEYSWWYDGTGPFTVHLRVDQIQTLDYPTYTLPIDVAVSTVAGARSFVIWDSLRTQDFELELPDAPTGVALDPGGWLLAEFTPGTAGMGEPRRARAFLAQSLPNPATPATTIRFGVVHAGTIALRIFDIDGRLVRTLLRGRRAAGEHRAFWDGADDHGRGLPNGIYCYQLAGPDGVFGRRLVLLRD